MPAGKALTSRRQRGFTYLIMLAALAIFGIGLAALGESWSAASRRDNEDELIKVGNAYVAAIEDYYLSSPGTPKNYPHSLGDLVEDRRFFGTVRHMRRLYVDPVHPDGEWGLVQGPDGGIIGVFSLSEKATLRKQPLLLINGNSISGERYSEWKFVYRPAS